MINDIDIILSIVKSNIRKISSSGVAVVSETLDIANARIEFDNGCVANITASRISIKNMQKMRIFQRNAYISMDFLSNTAEIIKIKKSEDNYSNSIPLNININQSSKQIFLERPEINIIDPLKTEIESFLISISENKTPTVSIYDGYQAIDVARKILEKIELSTSN